MNNVKLKILTIVEDNEKFAIKNRGYTNAELRHLGNVLIYKADRLEDELNKKTVWRRFYKWITRNF
jgi:hypothetical protein